MNLAYHKLPNKHNYTCCGCNYYYADITHLLLIKKIIVVIVTSIDIYSFTDFLFVIIIVVVYIYITELFLRDYSLKLSYSVRT